MRFVSASRFREGQKKYIATRSTFHFPIGNRPRFRFNFFGAISPPPFDFRRARNAPCCVQDYLTSTPTVQGVCVCSLQQLDLLARLLLVLIDGSLSAPHLRWRENMARHVTLFEVTELICYCRPWLASPAQFPCLRTPVRREGGQLSDGDSDLR